MRLSILDSGHKVRHKVLLGLMGVVLGGKVPDVVRTLLYRPRFFGRPFSRMVHDATRASSEWSVGECELFAAFVSRKNQCPF